MKDYFFKLSNNVTKIAPITKHIIDGIKLVNVYPVKGIMQIPLIKTSPNIKLIV